MWRIVRNDSQRFVLFTLQQIRWVNVRHDMKNTFLLTKMAQSLLIAGMVLGIAGAGYAQSGAGGAAGGGAGIGVGGGGAAGQAGAGSGAAAGQAGSEMSGMSKALPGLEQDSPMREQSVPGRGSSAEPRAGAAAGPDIPPGKKHTSRAAGRMKGDGSIGGESTSMGVGSSQEQGALRNPSLPRY